MRLVRALSIVVLMLGAGLSGCAINPYIVPARPVLPASADASTKVRVAMVYARNVYDAYAAKPVKEFNRQNALSTGLLITGAAALGMAAGSVHRDALLGTALVGGTAYQIGNWNSSSSRQAIYIEGRKSLSCAMGAIAPLELSEAELAEIRRQLRATVNAAGRASRSAGEVTRWLAIVSGRESQASPIVTAAQAELVAYGERFDAANKVIVHAGGAERVVGSAGALLMAHVETVRTLVDSALNDTLAALTALPQAIGDLARSAGIFAQGTDIESTLAKKVAAPGQAGKQGEDVVTAEDGDINEDGTLVARTRTTLDPVAQLSAAFGRLRERSARLETETAALRAVDPMAIEKMQAAVAACNPDLAKAMKPLATTPSTIGIEAGTPMAAAVAISGGTTPYTVVMLNSPMPGISTQVNPDTQSILITATASTVAGSTYLIRVTDSTQASTTVTIKVAAKAEATPAALARADSPNAGTPASRTRGNRNPAAERRATRTARLPPQTPSDRAAATTPSLPATAPIAPACVPLAEGRSCEVAGARCEFECGLGRVQMNKLRARLGLSGTPERFDVDVREKLRQLQQDRALPPTGDYNKATAQALDAMPR